MKNLLQSVTEVYYNVRQVLQSVIGCYQRLWVITKWYVTALTPVLFKIFDKLFHFKCLWYCLPKFINGFLESR